MRRLMSGFSLLEICFALAIVAIVSALAYPMYTQSIVHGRRVQAQATLLHLATLMENYYSDYQTYETARIKDWFSTGLAAQGFYQLQLTQQTQTSYRLVAHPLKSQAKQDPVCGDLIIDNMGIKSITGTGIVHSCWS